MAITTDILVEGEPHAEALAGIGSATVRQKEFDGVTFNVIGDAGEVILGVTEVVMQIPEDTINIDISGSSVTLSGTYIAGWEDIIIHITKAPEGEPGVATNLNDNDEFEPLSDKHVAPTFTSGFANVPDGEEIVKVKNDQKDYLDVLYDVTVEWEDPLVPGVTETETITVTHRVSNDWDAAPNWMDEYFKRNVEGYA